MLSITKQYSEPQFCERYKCSWQKMVVKWPTLKVVSFFTHKSIGILKAIRDSSLNTSCLGEEIAQIVFEKLTQPLILNTDKHNARHHNCLHVKKNGILLQILF